MAFTGDLQHLPIVDLIQLVHTTRKSGIFFVKGDKGESKIVFRNGHIVGANHINDTIRIGTVLVKMGAITIDDLKQVLEIMRDPAEKRALLAVLLQTGKLKREDAWRGLKKLVEMTIVELMSWTTGTFTFDQDTVVYAPEREELDVSVDAQMALMDALRVFDERERDRASGKEVPSFEAFYVDVLPEERTRQAIGEHATITADDLGLADLDRLERKIPRPASEMELFDPVQIHRQQIQELLTGFSPAEQEAFVTFLKISADRKAPPDVAAKQAGKAVVIFSNDRLLTHAAMTMCNEEGIPVFSTDNEADLDRIVSQCLSGMRMPLVVFDAPGRDGAGYPEETIIGVRKHVREKYAAVPLLQLAAPQENTFILDAYHDGILAVLPKPQKELRRETYLQDTMQLLLAFKSYVKRFQYRPEGADSYLKGLKNNVTSLREITNPSDAALVILAAVADMLERAVTFFVRPGELIGERAIGVGSEKSLGPTKADRLKISLAKPSVFRDALEKGKAYFGESSDEATKGLFEAIGKPLSRTMVLLPVICERKVVAIVYGDFGKNVASPVQLDLLEIVAQQVGIVLEYALFRRQAAKTAPKS